MFVLGAAFGSFLCCQARRLQKKGKHSNRSICLHCKKQLKWYDNIPILSWLFLKGKCRFCHKKIGTAEILSELLSALAFLALSFTINVSTASVINWISFALLIIFTLSLIFLAIYDGMTGELPTFALIIAVVLGVLSMLPTLINNFTWTPFLSAGLYGGIYLLLYLISKGKWVGDGDWIITTITGFVLGSPWLVMFALFIANLSACIVSIPVIKNKKNHQIYFGPYLVFAFVVVYIMAGTINNLLPF